LQNINVPREGVSNELVKHLGHASFADALLFQNCSRNFWDSQEVAFRYLRIFEPG